MVDVAVIGAGAAGLSAARALVRSGLEVVVLEARDRIGGRIHSLHDPAWPNAIELGAEFIHGNKPRTFELAKEAGLLIESVHDVHHVATSEGFESRARFWERMDWFTGQLPNDGPDRSVADFLQSVSWAPDEVRLFSDFVEGYHAAPLDRIRAQGLSTKGEEPAPPRENEQFRIPLGYDGVIHHLARGLDIRRRWIVRSVKWRAGRVELEGGEGAQPIVARAAIVTVPIGVLKAGAIAFEPELPPKTRAAIEHVEMGSILRVVLRFDRALWEEQHQISFGFVHAETEFPTWWTSRPAMLPQLVAWAGGPRAVRMSALDEAGLLDRVLADLSTTFRIPRDEVDRSLRGWWTHAWGADPYARGAYSYELVGAGHKRNALNDPVLGTLFFAGEALSDESGTVEGALESGARAAERVTRQSPP